MTPQTRNVIGIMMVLSLYLLPAGVALRENHRNFGGIFFLNLLLGFTIVGWIVALLWAIYVPRSER